MELTGAQWDMRLHKYNEFCSFSRAGLDRLVARFLRLLPPQGFGPEAKTRGGIIETPA